MNKELEFILEIVKEAGKLIPEDFVVEQKGSGYDLLTNVDLEVETFLISKIKENYPTFDIVSEEFNDKKKLTKNCFVIDPIDGTINFANKIPIWGIQVACIKNDKVVASAIYLVKQNELFYADENFAFLNGNKIRVSKYKELKKALYSVDGSNNLSAYKRLKNYSSNRRNFGAVCVSMAYVACGRIHGTSFGSDKPWDYLPGLHLVKMAGGETIDKKGCHAAASTQEFIDILEKETSKIINPPNVFVLHSLNGDTLNYWGKDVKEKMEDINIKTFLPMFPIREESTFEKFDEILKTYLDNGTLNENSIIIAHSIGNPYFIRFANKYNFVSQNYITIAPGGIYENEKSNRNDYIVEVKKQAYVQKKDLEFVKDRFKNKFCFYSDEDNKEKSYFERFINDINAKEIYLKGYNHFDGYHRIYQISELIQLLEECTKK